MLYKPFRLEFGTVLTTGHEQRNPRHAYLELSPPVLNSAHVP